MSKITEKEAQIQMYENVEARRAIKEAMQVLCDENEKLLEEARALLYDYPGLHFKPKEN